MNPADIPLREAPLAFLDVETTGLYPHKGDRVCEVGVVRCRGFEELEQFSRLLNPGVPIPLGATAVSGISDDMVRDAPTFADVADEFCRVIEDAVIVCHNAPFDIGFISEEMEIAGREPWDGVLLDTLAMARNAYRFRSNRLGSIARRLGINSEGAHRALADAIMTKEVFEHFAADLESRGGILVSDWLRLQGDVGWGNTTFGPMRHPLIEEAIRLKKKVRIRYITGGNRHSDRLIEPLHVEGRYLVAFCYMRGEERTFRLDRIVAVYEID